MAPAEPHDQGPVAVGSAYSLTAFRHEVEAVFGQRRQRHGEVGRHLGEVLDLGIRRLRAAGVEEHAIGRAVKAIRLRHPGHLMVFERCVR